MTPAPTPSHQELSGRLYVQLSSFVQKHDLGKVYYAPVDVYLSDIDTFQPDIIFISKARLHIITETRVDGAPDIVVEILSPSTGYYDLVHKKNVYESSGVKEYWIVDLAGKTVEVVKDSDSGFTLHTKAKTQGIVTSSILAGFQIDVTKLFADL